MIAILTKHKFSVYIGTMTMIAAHAICPSFQLMKVLQS